MIGHIEHIEEIARVACVMYGQDWNKIPEWTRVIWRESVRHARPNTVGVSPHEQVAIDAVGKWYAAQTARDIPQPAEQPQPVAETPKVKQ